MEALGDAASKVLGRQFMTKQALGFNVLQMLDGPGQTSLQFACPDMYNRITPQNIKKVVTLKQLEFLSMGNN